MSAPALLVTCEHSSARVPADLQDVFRGAKRALASHRAHDPGALELARRMARRAGTTVLAGEVTRLVVDLNRSSHHRAVFSEWTRKLAREEREALFARYWSPHRERVRAEVDGRIARTGRCVHVAVHSFTPVLDGRERRIDVAWLYDPRRARERALCSRWMAAVAARAPELRLRRNAPYRGDADGLTTHLRGELRPARYLGIELELSQRLPAGPRPAWVRVQRALVDGLLEALA